MEGKVLKNVTLEKISGTVPGWYRNGHDAGVNPRVRVLQFGNRC